MDILPMKIPDILIELALKWMVGKLPIGIGLRKVIAKILVNFRYVYKLYSELYLSQTGRQLIETMDQTVLEIRINPVQLRELATKMGIKLDGEERREFIEDMLFPLYLKLREKGYNHKELAR